MKSNSKMLEAIIAIGVIVIVYIAAFIIMPRFDGKSDRSKEKADIKNEENYIPEKVLSNCTIVIDSGHGGIDPGKVSAAGVLEKDINLSIANKLKELLENIGAKVIMTRIEDCGLYDEDDSNKKSSDMRRRCDIINGAGIDMCVSIHQNSYKTTSVSGYQMFYYKDSKSGKYLADCLQEGIHCEIGDDNKRIAKADSTYYLLCHSKVPLVIAECGFLSNERDASLLVNEEYQYKLANGMKNGIIKYWQNCKD